MSTLGNLGRAAALAGALAMSGPANGMESMGETATHKPGCVLNLRDASSTPSAKDVFEGEVRDGVLRTSYNRLMWIEVMVGGKKVRMPGILGSDALYENCIPAANEAGVLDLVVETDDSEVHQKLVEDLRGSGLRQDVAVRVRVIAGTDSVEDTPEKEG